MDDIKKKLDLLKEAKETAEEHAEEAECVQKSLEAGNDAVSIFMHIHIVYISICIVGL